MSEKSYKKAITYSLLAHIRNTSTLSNGALDIFIPIIKKVLYKISNELQKSNSILDIQKVVLEDYDIDIPIPTLKSILILISKDVNKDKETNAIELFEDNSYCIKDFVFEDFDELIENSTEEVNSIQKLYKQFCIMNSVKKDNTCIFKFIEKNQSTLGEYLTNKKHTNGNDYSLEARFVDFFKKTNFKFYESIRNIYLGSILVTYLEYKPSELKLNVDLLFDTNFIISLLDLNTPESTHTCKKLLDVCSNLGFTFHILDDTIDEIRGLISSKAKSIELSSLQKYINKEDVLNACIRRKLNRNDLERIADNVKDFITSNGISIVHKTDKFKNIAKVSEEYRRLKIIRNSSNSALHDAACIAYVRDKRNNKSIRDFNLVNCWFVNNSFSHDYDINNLKDLTSNSKSQYQSESINVNELLNILWLSSPQINITDHKDILDIGLTTLISYTLNRSLPKASIIKELEENIQKYKSEDISDRDIYLIASRISEGQLKDIEKINELSDTNTDDFNKRLKEEAEKQEKLEAERSKKVNHIVKSLESAVKEINNYKSKRKDEIELIQQDIEVKWQNKYNNLEREKRIIENENRKIKRDEFIKEELKKWRKKTWIIAIIFLILVLVYFSYIGINMFTKNLSVKDVISNYWIGLIVTLIFSISDFLFFKCLYDKYNDYSNIEAYIKTIKIPENLADIIID